LDFCGRETGQRDGLRWRRGRRTWDDKFSTERVCKMIVVNRRAEPSTSTEGMVPFDLYMKMNVAIGRLLFRSLLAKDLLIFCKGPSVKLEHTRG
jgi:hypothetical protein